MFEIVARIKEDGFLPPILRRLHNGIYNVAPVFRAKLL